MFDGRAGGEGEGEWNSGKEEPLPSNEIGLPIWRVGILGRSCLDERLLVLPNDRLSVRESCKLGGAGKARKESGRSGTEPLSRCSYNVRSSV